jgi:aspartate/methionine/tyrosine aminotransferase
VAHVNALNTIWLNTPAQYAALAALRGLQEPFAANHREYTRKMKLLVEGLSAIPGIECRMPDGTYYCFPSHGMPAIKSTEFARYLMLTEGVLVQAGTIFGRGGEGHFRSSCSEAEDELRAGLAGLARAVERLGQDGPAALKLEQAA